MSKKKKINKPHLKHRKDAATEIFSLIKSIPDTPNIRDVYQILKNRLSSKEMADGIRKLELTGKIHILPKGEIRTGHRLKSNKSEIRQVYSGTIDVTSTGAAYVMVEGLQKDVYVPRHKVNTALEGDWVEVKIVHGKKRYEGEVIRIIRRFRETFVGRLEVSEKFAFFRDEENILHRDVFIPVDRLYGAAHNSRVLIRVTNWNPEGKNPRGEVIETIDATQSIELDMKLCLIRNGFSTEFPMDVLLESERIPEQIPATEIKKREDIREVLTFTIDPIDAKDFDDAISYRKKEDGLTEIGVHIADVSHYIREESLLDEEAAKRGTSVYLPDRVCPMLPEKISNGLCSLRPNEDKLTFSVFFDLNEKGESERIRFAKTVIHSNQRFTYEDVQEIFEKKEGRYADELLHTLKLTKQVRARRFADGAIGFEKEEVRFRIGEDGRPQELFVKVRKDAHLMIEDLMLMANEAVARLGSSYQLEQRNKPFVYRIHDRPDPSKLEQLATLAKRFGHHLSFDENTSVSAVLNQLLKNVQGKPEQNLLENLAIRSMAKAEYTTKNIGHYGLAMKHYTHFTSPIRRYPDVLVHRLLEQILVKSDRIIDGGELEGKCKVSSHMERKAMEAEREAVKYMQVLYLQKEVGKSFDGYITGVITRGLFVEMTEHKCEGFVSTARIGKENFLFEEHALRLRSTKTGASWQIGDPVKVKLISADIFTQKIDLELLSPANVRQK